MDFCVEMSMGLIDAALHSTWSVLLSMPFAQDVGLILNSARSYTKERRDKELANLCFRFSLSLSEKFALWQLEYTHGLPMVFRLLRSPDHIVRAMAPPIDLVWCTLHEH